MEKYQFSDAELMTLEKQPTPLAVYQYVDRHVYTLALSDGFCEIFGYSDRAKAYQVSNQNSLNNTHPDDTARVADAVHRFAVEDVPYDVVFRSKMDQGQDCRIIHAIGKHVYTDTGVRLAYVWYTDEGEYTEEEKTKADSLKAVFNSALREENFLKANYYDTLTRLPNMTHFFAMAKSGKEALEAQNKNAAMLYIDLNGMKAYNETRGFTEGDKLLKGVALVLERAFDNENCCHISADRFAVFAEEDGLEEKLRRVFGEIRALNGGNSLPARVGIYSFHIEDVAMSTACDRAKDACDAIAKSDTSCFRYYSSEMHHAIARRQHILSHLDRAMSERWIQVYYQPIVRAVSGKVCEEEALARWIDPVEGFLSPDEFIPTLENAGLIYKLDLYVLGQVLIKIRKLEAAGLYIVPQSINLSRSDFDACDIVEEIRKRVDESGISRSKLTIEITESIIGRDFEFIREQVERFRSLGFSVWMDDFGSGYSSLDVLHSIQFDLIKFDMSFLRKLEDGDSGRIILTEMMKMATALGVDTVCEGVETEEQVRFLQTIGCSKLQGYYFLRPVPLKTILERYEKNIQIGLENPAEAEYFDTVGRVNLFDASFMASGDRNVLQNTYDTVPMGIIELDADMESLRFIRSNRPFCLFLSGVGAMDRFDDEMRIPIPQTGHHSDIMKRILECCRQRSRMFIDEKVEDGSLVHSFVRYVSTNPVTRSTAVAIVILSVEGPRMAALSVEYDSLLRENEQLRKEASAARKIAELQDSVTALLTHMPAMTFSKDVTTGRYLACNQAFVEYAGKTAPEEVVGLSDGEIFDPETARHFVEDDKKALEMDGPYIFFEDVPDAAGRRRQFQTTKLKFIDNTGRRCLLGLCQDVTEAVRIRRERDFARAAYEQARDASAVYARLNDITGNYLCTYVADPKTGHYREFSATDGYEESFDQAKEGEDFFAALREATRCFCHPEDRERVMSSLSREQIMDEIRRKGIYTLDYRILKDGTPVYVQLNAVMETSGAGSRLIVGLSDVDAKVRQQKIGQEIARQREIYDQITASLAEQYDTLYYIDIETGTYVEIASTDEYKRLNVPATGNDFFAESRRSIRRYVHPDDQGKALHLHYKDVMLNNLKQGNSFSMNWRLVVDGQVRHIRHTEILSRDAKHIIVCIKKIDAEVQASLALEEDQKKSVTFTQIAERLADHYDMIYYIDCDSEHYVELSARKQSGKLKIQEEGDRFFETARKNANWLIYSEDLERVKLFLDRDRLISQLEDRRQVISDYRMVIDSNMTQYTRMSATYSSDRSHFIICVENREEEVRREQEHLAALSLANLMARRDELTHTKNKTAYHEMENELQKQIDEGNASFGVVVCDINGLKVINDTQGHKAGDQYIRDACMLICRSFAHSPVYRIGGDEFVVVLTGEDYVDRTRLLSVLRRQVEENIRMGDGPVLAAGQAEYLPDEDHLVEEVFNRADSQMYENKTYLKERKQLQESRSFKEGSSIRFITDERRFLLDGLFRSFEVVAEGTYVFVCDMKYDFSRWSKNAVDIYGLPSEYMYGAGDIWEDHIHPEDREAYHRGIDEIFSGNLAGHDMQYRARRATGEYDVCTCRGTVVRDPSGEPDYFAGAIRNHSSQGHIDTLTGLKNQYGFFEDLDSYLNRKACCSVMLFGIRHFHEINEMYGYHYGNRVLQFYARKALELAGNKGQVYRIDGTKYALISGTLPVPVLEESYRLFQAYLRGEFQVDNKKIMLELHGGALRVDSFDIDSQTIYSCLNYADEESKRRQQGNLVEFHNDLNAENHRRLEQLHAIRASIMQGYEGFYLLYQPVVDANTEQLIGAEALLRWENGTFGRVQPDQFVPVLESDPLFPLLGRWILREAVIAARRVLQDYPDFVMNVNLSYTQLEKPDFVDMVAGILEELDYPPEHLCLEVTERCRLLNLELLKNVVANLKSRGILIALDDFGTGFSSISILKEIPVNIIKIDRCFVTAVEKKDSDRRIVRTIADLASIFGAKVCIEGVETGKMRDILKDYQVESFQGYYYAKPLRIEELLKWRGAEPD